VQQVLHFASSARFFLVQHTKVEKYTKWALNIPICRKREPMGIQYTHIFHRKNFQNFPKFTQIGIFGLKIYHPATLCLSSSLAYLQNRFWCVRAGLVLVKLNWSMT
jgi:hypothetical protein